MVSAMCSAAAHLVGIVGIDDQRFGQLPRGAGELRQDEHAVIVVARGDEFLGDQVHAVMQAADETQIGGAEIARRPRAAHDARP